MPESLPYQLLADAILVLHVALALFIVGGLVLIILGNIFGWHWVDSLWFRLAHLVAIGAVVAETWLGIACPLTTLEIWLRAQAKASTYSGNFIEHWLQALLFWQAPPWAFTIAYSVFGLAVAATWWRFPPRVKHAHSRRQKSS